jgi:photosystem II stability/assembly factor-like uncharacterized protein
LALTEGNFYSQTDRGPVYRSQDGGVTWEEVLSLNTHLGTLEARGDQVWVAQVSGGSTARFDIVTSDDAGETWSTLDSLDGVPYDLEPTESGEALVATADGVWLPGAAGIIAPEGTMDGASVLVLQDGSVMFGAFDGVSRTTDEGIRWEDQSEGMIDDDHTNVSTHPTCPGLAFLGTQCKSGLYRTTDGGGSFDRSPVYMHYTMSTIVSPFDPAEIWSASDVNLMRSHDYGESWHPVYPFGDTTLSMDASVHMHGVALDPFHPGTVLIGTVGSGIWADDAGLIYRSEDDGETWVASSEGLPLSEASIHVLHYAQTVADVVLAGTFRGGDIAHNGPPGIGLFRSVDGGRSWTLADLPARDVAFLAECGGRIYAATDAGVALSDDAGATWRITSEVRDEHLALACHGDTVVTLDPGLGILRSDDRGETWYDWTGEVSMRTFTTQDRLAGLGIRADGLGVYLAIRKGGSYLRAL